jgi:hypothetical protein
MQRLVLLSAVATLAAACSLAAAQAATKAQPPRSAASVECSKQADAKGLHGKERHSFRAKCKRDLGKTAKTKS